MNADLTTADLALRLRCSKWKVLEESKRHGIGINLGGRAGYRFTEDDVEALRRALAVPAKVETRRFA